MLYKLGNKKPKLDKTSYVHPSAEVIGDVTISSNASIWPNAVLRADRNKIFIGKNSNIQDCSVVHTSKNFPVKIKDNVSIGHSVVLHGCKIDSNTVIGMGAIMLNGVKIGKNCLIGAGTLLTQNTKIPDNSLAFGFPAKVKRRITKKELKHIKENTKIYTKLAKQYSKSLKEVKV